MPRLALSDGSLEAMKWLALFLMTGDHINKYLFNGTVGWAFCMGRLALPLFVTVLAYKLAHPDAVAAIAFKRTILRMIVAGTIATPAYIALGGQSHPILPLNIMFALAATVGMVILLELRTVAGYTAAAAMFLVAGSSVEYWWPALALGLAVWWYAKQPCWEALVLSIVALIGLWCVNGNLWAVAAAPVVLIASYANPRIPRLRWFFYAYYPFHLTIFWLIRIPMRDAGYMFF
jgi:hypothetical protein